MVRICSRALIALLSVTGSAFALEATDLAGTWSLDQDAFWEQMKTQPEFASIPAEHQAMIKKVMLQKMGNVTWNFGPDGASFTGMNGASQAAQKPKSWTSTGAKTATVVPDDEKAAPVNLELKDDGKLFITTTSREEKHRKVTLVLKKGEAGKP